MDTSLAWQGAQASVKKEKGDLFPAVRTYAMSDLSRIYEKDVRSRISAKLAAKKAQEEKMRKVVTGYDSLFSFQRHESMMSRGRKTKRKKGNKKLSKVAQKRAIFTGHDGGGTI